MQPYHPAAGHTQRYAVRGASPTYTVEGLESLAWRGLLTPDTEVARAGDTAFRAIREWDFAEQVFPNRPPLLFKPTAALALVPLRQELARAAPETAGRHITTLDEIRTLIIRDPNDPQALQLLNNLKDDMLRDGLTAPQAFENFFLSNRELNRRLTLKVVYRHVGEMVRTHRAAALVGIITVDVFLGGMIICGDGEERAFALAGAAFTNVALGLLSVYAYHVQRWLNLNPVLAAVGMIGAIYLSFNIIIAAILSDATNFLFDADFWRILLKLLLPVT